MDHVKEAQRNAKKEATLQTAYEKWLAEPMTRMGLSMVPAADKDDTLRLLLRSAFDAGAGAGEGSTVGDFMEVILEGMLKREQRRDDLR